MRRILLRSQGRHQKLLRMLRPHELAAAMSLKDYVLKGKMEDQVKQIGNAVPVKLAAALCHQVLQ